MMSTHDIRGMYRAQRRRYRRLSKMRTGLQSSYTGGPAIQNLSDRDVCSRMNMLALSIADIRRKLFDRGCT